MMINQNTFNEKWQAAVSSGRKPLGLYIHIPFCKKKCRYCDFVSFAGCEGDMDPYVDRLCEEIRRQGKAFSESVLYSNLPGGNSFADNLSAEKLSMNSLSVDSMSADNLPGDNLSQDNLSRSPFYVDSIFIGGGTPSLLSSGQLGKIVRAVDESFVCVHPEFTVECNPGTVDEEKLRAMKALGVSRISLGVQSLSNPILKKLGRIHDSETALKAMDMAAAAGLDYNVDLMFGVPGQTLGIWKKTLRKAVEKGPAHISFYSLQLEEDTPLFDAYREGRVDLPEWEENREMYHFAVDFLKEAGYHHYEISNAALPGRECRHNIKYWTMGDYLGLGLAAYSFVNGKRFYNTSDMDRYLYTSNFGRYDEEPDETGLKGDWVFTALRLTEGFALRDYDSYFGNSFAADSKYSPTKTFESSPMKTIESSSTKTIESSFMKDFGEAVDALVADGLLEVYERKPHAAGCNARIVPKEFSKSVPDERTENALNDLAKVDRTESSGGEQTAPARAIPDESLDAVLDASPDAVKWVRMTKRGLDYTNPVMEKLLEQLSADRKTADYSEK